MGAQQSRSGSAAVDDSVSPVCVLCEAEAGKPWRDMSKDERRQFKQEGRTFTCRGCRTPKRTSSIVSTASHGRRSPLWNLVMAPAEAGATVGGPGSNSTQQHAAAWQPDLRRIQSGQLLSEDEQQQPPREPKRGPSSSSLVPIGEQRLAATPVASQAQPCTAASKTPTAKVAGVQTLSLEDAGVAAAYALNTIAQEAALAAVRPDKAHSETGCEAELASGSSAQAASEDAVPEVLPVRAG